MTQRKTQTAAYWQEQFSVSNQDIEFIYNQILEANSLFNLEEVAIALVRRHCEVEELETRSELQRGKLYQPKGSFSVAEKVVFPLLNFALGTVKYTRQGNHPEYGNFTVIGIDFENGHSTHEFVAEFEHPHTLNIDEQSLANLQGLMSPEELYQTYADSIRPKVKATLEENNDFVEFHGQYFLRDLLVDFHEGLFNIADAAVDINAGPLDVDALIEHTGLAPKTGITDILRFSVSYHLANDQRFDDVGPTGQIMWYLDRLAPPEVRVTPPRLKANIQPYDSSSFDEDLRALLAELDDEITNPEEIPTVGPKVKKVTIVLNYPHWRVGALPLTPKTQSFFPISSYNPVLFEFVDDRTGDTFPGWSVLSRKYVFGLDKWYQKYKLPAGAYIDIKRTADPMRVIIDYRATRSKRDWIRAGAVLNNKLAIQMTRTSLGCECDEQMTISHANVNTIDDLWTKAEEKQSPLYDILCYIIPELSKLSPQSAVHAKTLYSVINLIRRVSPGMIFQELNDYSCFVPVKHGYWIYDSNMKDD